MSIFDILKKKQPPLKTDNSYIKSEINRLIKNEIIMEVDDGLEELSPDACKIGGKPFLPDDFLWPTFTSTEDHVTRPLSFFCQLNLSEVAELDNENLLPDHGLLAFFYECESFCWGFDPKDKGAAKVYYFEDTTGFKPFDIPKELDEMYIMPELGIQLKMEKSVPSFEELEMHSNLTCDYDEYENAINELDENIEIFYEGHKILGYADVIQGEMLTDCERASRGLYSGDPESFQNTPDDVKVDIQNKANQWMLLLQLSTIEKDDFEWMFGDCGMLYFYIKKEDLVNKRFENSWFSVQCG